MADNFDKVSDDSERDPLIFDENGDPRPMKMSKKRQISAPSHQSILDLLDRAAERQAAKTTFNGRRVTRQVYLNSIILGIHEFGREFEDRAYEVGATILRHAERAAEVELDPYTARHELFLASQARAEAMMEKAKIKKLERETQDAPREVSGQSVARPGEDKKPSKGKRKSG